MGAFGFRSAGLAAPRTQRERMRTFQTMRRMVACFEIIVRDGYWRVALSRTLARSPVLPRHARDNLTGSAVLANKLFYNG